MSDIYTAGIVPASYDAQWLREELDRISASFLEMEIPHIRLTPVHVEPIRPREGSVANADGTDWNPGSGAGLYEYGSGGWNKL